MSGGDIFFLICATVQLFILWRLMQRSKENIYDDVLLEREECAQLCDRLSIRTDGDVREVCINLASQIRDRTTIAEVK